MNSGEFSANMGKIAAAGECVLIYKVVEISTVTEVELEEALNKWVSQGWQFDGMQFAMRESSKRPAMAFVIFCREGEN